MSVTESCFFLLLIIFVENCLCAMADQCDIPFRGDVFIPYIISHFDLTTLSNIITIRVVIS